MWSPALRRWVRAVVAPSPELKAMQCLAPSSEARHFSRELRVGLPLREYSYLKGNKESN